MITTIIFDLAEVYLKGYYGVEEYLERVLHLPASEIEAGLQCPEYREFMRGKFTEEEYWQFLAKKNNWQADTAAFKQAIRDNFAEIEGTREIIEKLKSKGYKLGLLSDHAREWIDYCEQKFNFHKLFDSRQYSFEVDYCKSDKRTFELMLEKLGEKAENCLFIDDRDDNIAVAKSVGLGVIQFKNPEQLKKELANYSIKLD